MYVYIYTHRYSYTYICMYIHVRTIRLIYVYIQLHYIFIYFSKSIECGSDVSFVSAERPSVDIDVCAHVRVCVLKSGNYTLKKLVVTGEAELIGTHCNTLQHSAKHCNSLQFTATHCNSLQPTATHCNCATIYNSRELSVELCLSRSLSPLPTTTKKLMSSLT